MQSLFDSIGLKLGKDKALTPYLEQGKTTLNYRVFSLCKIDTDRKPKVVNLKKNLSQYSKEEINQLLDTLATYAVDIIRKANVDLVLAPRSSSQLLNQFLDKVKEKIPNLHILENSLVKSLPEDVSIDENIQGLSDLIRKSLLRLINKAKLTGIPLEMKSIVPPQNRKFIKGFLSLSKDFSSRQINNKNVMIIDDFLTSGATLVQAFKLATDNSARSVQALTIFKFRN